MNRHPVFFSVTRPDEYAPIQLLFRVLAFFILGMLGLSFGLVFLVAYLALPLYTAARLQNDGTTRFQELDYPRLTRALGWFAAVYAWMGLLVDRLPTRSPSETVDLTVSPVSFVATPAAALWRIVSGLPSLLVLCVLNLAGIVVWFVGAVTILIQRRIGAGTHRFLFALQRFGLRLLAYEAGLCDELPRFEFAEPTLPVHP